MVNAIKHLHHMTIRGNFLEAYYKQWYLNYSNLLVLYICWICIRHFILKFTNSYYMNIEYRLSKQDGSLTVISAYFAQVWRLKPILFSYKSSTLITYVFFKPLFDTKHTHEVTKYILRWNLHSIHALNEYQNLEGHVTIW